MSASKNLHITDAGAGTSCEGSRSGRGSNEASQVVIMRNPRKTSVRTTWTKYLNRIVMKCYLKSDPTVRGYRQRMHKIWQELGLLGLFELSEQKLAGQARVIKTNKWLSSVELEELKREIEREDSECNLALQEEPEMLHISSNCNEVDLESENTTSSVEDHVNLELPLNLVDTIDMLKRDGRSDEEVEILSLLHDELLKSENMQKPTNLRFVDRKKLKAVTAKVNKVIPYLTINSLYQYNQVLKASANVVKKLLGISNNKKQDKNKEPWWKKRLTWQISELRKDIGKLEALKNKTLKNEVAKERLFNKYSIKNKGICYVIEELKQRVDAQSAKIKRYTNRIEQYRQNRLFENNQKLLFEQIEGIERGNEVIPDANESRTFWKSIWENDVRHNEKAEWIRNVKQEISYDLIPQTDLTITVETLRVQVRKLANWKAPGPDGVQGYWFKNLTSIHPLLGALLNDCLNSGETPDWLTRGTTVLIMKDKSKGGKVTNYRPITCLSILWKLFTSIFSDSIYQHLDQNELLPVEQKGCRKNSRGTKDQLIIDKMILRNCRKRNTNLVMGWVDYKKAFDMVPHSWIMECLEMFGIAPNVQKLLSKSMRNWETELTSGGTSLGKVSIKRGIFQGDSLSPLLFVISLIPMSILLRDVKAGYELGKGLPIINHLLFMDDLKVFGKNEKQLDTLINTVRIFSNDIGMEFGISKCAVLVMKRGKLSRSEGLELPTGEIIRNADSDNGYKYLGILEADQIKHLQMKDKVSKEYLRRLRKILKSSLNSRNMITAINSRAVSIIRYTGGIIDWNTDELQKLDRKTRKLLTTYGVFHQKGDVDRLYIPRKEGGRGLMGIEDIIRIEEGSLFQYVSDSQEEFLKEVEREGLLKKGPTKKEIIRGKH